MVVGTRDGKYSRKIRVTSPCVLRAGNWKKTKNQKPRTKGDFSLQSCCCVPITTLLAFLPCISQLAVFFKGVTAMISSDDLYTSSLAILSPMSTHLNHPW